MPDVTPRWKSPPPAAKNRKRLRPVSVKRQAENVQRRANVIARFGQHPPCFACPILRAAGIDTGCNGRADDAHELLRRSKGGSITDVDGIVPIGRRCHMWVGDNVTEARSLGLEVTIQARTD